LTYTLKCQNLQLPCHSRMHPLHLGWRRVHGPGRPDLSRRNPARVRPPGLDYHPVAREPVPGWGPTQGL